MNSKVIFSDGTEFTVLPYPLAIEPSIFEKKRNAMGIVRDIIRFTIESDYTTIATKFVNNAQYIVRQYSIDVDDEGNEIETIDDFDKSEFCIAGDIVDHRDGRITVYMGKKTEDELRMEALKADSEALAILLGGELA